MNDWQDVTVMITGGFGFVGSCLTMDLVSRGATVVCVDVDEISPKSVLDPTHSRVRIEKADVTNQKAVKSLLSDYNIDTLYHLAAQSLVTDARADPTTAFENNIKGTWTVLDAARQADISTNHIVVASSDKVYGPTDHLPYTEQTELTPNAPYPVSKLAADRIARIYHRNYGLPVSIARCSNIYGPGDLNFSRLIPSTIRKYLRGDRPVIRSDGTPTRDYLYIDDALAAYRKLGAETAAIGEAFNFGTGLGTTVFEVVTCVADLLGVSYPDPIVKDSAEGEITHQRVSSEKAANVLDWSHEIELKEGLKRTTPWYREIILEND